MSLKKLFKSSAGSKITQSPKQQFNVSSSVSIESYDAVQQKTAFERKIYAFVDISASLGNYVRFGLAEEHYETSIQRIYKNYPYDGSQAEKYKFLNDSNTFDYWIWKDKYPKTTGYITLNADPLLSQRVEIKAGPNVDNVHSTASLQGNNLYFDSSEGVTVEFWANPTPVAGDSAFFELKDSTNGSLSIQPTYSASDIVWTVDSQQHLSVEANIAFTSLSDHATSWHHYAFVLTSLGSGSGLTASLYVDGVFTEQKIDASHNIGDPINTIEGFVGQFDDPGGSSVLYYTGSVDEFRYWKTPRTAEEIGLNWNTHVNGGSNLTGTLQRPLSLYLKFNEGVTGLTNTDQKVLDYSGRVASASIMNYLSSVRSTESAIQEFNAAYYEVPDPIVYSFHPDVSSLETTGTLEGRVYDDGNRHSFYALQPEWIRDEDTQELRYLSHMVGAYFDELYAQISSFEKIKNKDYQDQDLKIFPFYSQMLESQGFNTDNFLVGADVLSELDEKTKVGTLTTGSISDLKNKVYRNIYNNLLYLYKSKGTQASVRNLLNCYGIDHNLMRLRTFSNFTTTNIANRDQIELFKDKTVDFYGLKNHISGTSLPNVASVFNYTSSDSNNQSFLPSLGEAFSIESNVYFPRQQDSTSNFYFGYDTSGSIFGVHAANHLTASDASWYGDDLSSMTAYSVHSGKTPRYGKFVLSSSAGTFTAVETDVYNLFDATNWNLAIIFEPQQDLRNQPPSPESPYWARLVGYQIEAGQTINSFNISSSVSYALSTQLLPERRRVFVGAERTNNTGSLEFRSLARIGNCKFYADSLEADEVLLHAKYKNSEGRLRPFENANRKNDNDTIFAPHYLTTLFHWDFEQITTPDSLGQFEAKDITSASLNFTGTFGGYGDAVSKVYTGFGYNFPTDIKLYETEHVTKLGSTLPDESTAANVVNSQGESTIIFQPNQAPPREATLLGKSMYEVISEDMLKAFAGITDFNYLIGNPVNKYRMNYKDMEGLRRLYFETVENTPSLEKFTNYFSWLDGIIDSVINNIFPATTNLASSAKNIVESHVLERSKYSLKYPTMEFKPIRPTASISGIVSLANLQLTTASMDDAVRDGDDDLSAAPFNYKSSSLSVPNYVNVVEIGATTIPSGNITNPVIIQNSPYTTSSDDLRRVGSEAPRNFASSTIGNYRHTYDVVNAVGQHGAINGLYLANESVPATTPSPYVSGAIPYGMPARNKYQTIIRSIFNAPGGPETHGEGLDIATRELSVYNDLNYRNRIVRNSLNSLYKLPSAFGGYQSGSTVTASYHGIYRNGYTRPVALATASYSSQSILFDGTNDFILFNESPETNRLVKFTISAWINYSSTSGFETVLELGAGAASPIEQGITFQVHVGSEYPKLTVSFDGNEGAWSSTSANTLIRGRWHHVAWSYDASSADNDPILYIDGVSVAITEDATPVGVQVRPAGISRLGMARGGENFEGYIDEVSVWNTAFNDAELKELYHPHNAILGPANLKQHTAATANSVSPFGYLQTWWRMGEGTTVATAPDPTPTVLLDQMGYLNGSGSGFVHPAGTASFPPSNSAGTLNSYTTYGTKKIWDNAFVQTQIPATDLQYAWISASHATADLNRYQNTTNQFAGNEQIKFVSSSNFGAYNLSDAYGLFGSSDNSLASWTPISFVRTNNIIYEPITASSNLLGYDLGAEFILADAAGTPGSYFNVDYAKLLGALGNSFIREGVGGGAALNALLLHRNGPYGFPSWKAIRKHDNPIVISQRESNIISYFTESKSFNFFGLTITTPSLQHASESCVSTTAPLFVQLSGTTFDFKTTYENSKLGFTNNDLQVHQGAFEEGVKNKTTFLDKVLKEEELSISKLTVLSNIYPKTKYQFLDSTRTRDVFDNQWWRTDRDDRVLIDQINSLGIPVTGTTSRWSMDANINFTTGLSPASASNVASGSGELQNHYTTFSNQYPPPTTPKYGPLYARRSLAFNYIDVSAAPTRPNSITYLYDRIITTSSITDGGVAAFEVPSGSGKQPFYNSYSAYAEELRIQGKDYSIVPEFRMDDHIETYLSNGFDFKAQQATFLSLTGTSNTNIANRYSAAELSDVLGTIQSDTNLGIKKFGLKAKAYLKLLPYEGFYPQQRTIQLAAELSESMKNSFEVYGTNASYGTALKPFISPGILFNTIKSGVAVDKIIFKVAVKETIFPSADDLTIDDYSGISEALVSSDLVNRDVFGTGSVLVSEPLPALAAGKELYTAIGEVVSETQGSGDMANHFASKGITSFLALAGPRNWVNSDRLPFEAIINPAPYISDWYHGEISPGYLDSRVVATDAPKINYTLMANNFFAETVNFFIKRGLTNFESDARDIFTFDTGKEYAMDVIMRNSNFSSVSDFSLKLETQTPGATLSSSFRVAGGLATASKQCEMYNDPNAFGIQTISTLAGGGNTVYYRSWAGSTPPYYNGFARARLQFQPEQGVSSYTMGEIVEKMTASYFRADEASQRILVEDPNNNIAITVAGTGEHMQMSASLVLDSVVEEKNTQFNEDGDILGVESYDSPRHKLAIHTRFECPILNFSGSTGSAPYSGAPTVHGMWHQYGEIPNYSDKGVFVEVMDMPFRERTTPRLTSSLADAIGMFKDKKAIGNIASSRQIEEALVVVPYYVDRTTSPSQERFFEYHDETVEKMMKKANRPSVPINADQIVRQIRLMKKYVFPPFMDFVTFPNEASVKSPLMYVFEFGRTLSQQDLADIWQGVLPDCGRIAQYQEAVIDLDTTYEGFDSVGPDSTDIIGQNVKTLLASGDISILDSDTKSLNKINFNELDFYVFKVKKRAEYDYSRMVKNTMDDQYTFDFKTKGFASTQPFFKDFGENRLSYSYNYPYDFFSLIELAKVDAQIEMEDTEE